MLINIDNILLIGSVLLIVSIIAGKTSSRFGVPTLILFVIIGMLAGSEGIGGIIFDEPKIAQFIGIVALNFILFSGGLDTKWESIKPIFRQGIVLSTLGVLITTVSVGVFVYYITDFSLTEGLLLGAIVSSTDAAAVFSILRSRSLGLKHNLRATLELESGSNDPMAYFLTISLTSLVLNPAQNALAIIPHFFLEIILGAIMGLLSGRVGKILINRIMMSAEGLYPVLVIALMFFSFSASNFIGGNGFLTVYLCGLHLGNQDLLHKKTIIKVFDGFAWLMQIILFLTLGLLVFPSHIIPVLGSGLLVSLFLILVARPLSVFSSLAFFKVKTRSKWFISWVGLRGAVPIVFATYPLIAGVDKASMIFNIVFFISLTSVIIQGTTLPFVARWLHVAVPGKVKRKTSLDLELSDTIKSVLSEVELPENSELKGKKIVDLHFPKRALITIINRQGKYITPNGMTELEPSDKLIVLAETDEILKEVYKSLHLPDDHHGEEH